MNSAFIDLIPAFDIQRIFINPWTTDLSAYLPIMLMGFFVAASCALVGNYIILRKMALVGDAISHSLLPGIVVIFLLFETWNSLPMLFGAAIAGVVTVVLIELIHKNSRIKPDAAIGIVFTTLFAVGVVLISLFTGDVHLDAECVLYGEIGYIPLEDDFIIAGLNLGKTPVVRMAVVFFVLLLLMILFYKEMLITSFDPGLAAAMGIRPSLFHFGLTILLSIVIVSSFEAVGVILVIAMIIFPGATAMLLSDRFPIIILLSVLFSALYPLGGLHLSVWLSCSIAGAMTVAAGLVFLLVWIAAPKRGLLVKYLGHRRELKEALVTEE